ncbi:hypothetical protein ACFXA3_12890 [Streptomyces sp. NPDC059456]|uniref:hypothetical protein n=1 Tax=Streptomyces sp. NPDC059456 TaxID=3346838 RepID=UPI0036A91F06
MTSSTPTAGAVLLAAGVLVLTGCGTKVSGSGAAAAPSPVPSSAQTPDHAARQAAAVARHDALFPEMARLCADRATAVPSVPPDDLPTDPEARKYAENHGYKSQFPLSPQDRCRGDAHAARIKAALGGGEGKDAPRTTQELSRLLTGMGYKPETGDVYGSGPGNLAFVLKVPESGPCVTGRVSVPVQVEAHGAYLESGCREPRGGH